MNLNPDLASGTHIQLGRFLRHCERASKTPMIWGDPGIGKSEVVFAYAQKRAVEMKRDFVVWHALPFKEKELLFRDRLKRLSTYILYDNRAASNDSTDDKGIPNIQKDEYLQWVQNMVYKIFEMPETAGLLFNDEMTLAPTLVQNSMYKMVYDRAVGDIAFNDEIFIVCAGNRAQDQAFVQDTPLPLRTRMIHFQLQQADKDAQIKWFIENGLDDRLIAFFAKNSDKINTEFSMDSGEFTANRPRCIVFCSDLIKPLEYPESKEDIQMCSVGAMSDIVGRLFMKFLEGQAQIDIDEYIAQPKKVEELRNNADALYGLVSLASHKYYSTKKNKKGMLTKILGMFDYMDKELGILMLRMMKEKHKARFVKDIVECPQWENIAADVFPIVKD